VCYFCEVELAISALFADVDGCEMGKHLPKDNAYTIVGADSEIGLELTTAFRGLPGYNGCTTSREGILQVYTGL